MAFRNEYAAGRAPGVNDDATEGFGPGSEWWHLGARYVCQDATDGQAEWVSATFFIRSRSPTASDTHPAGTRWLDSATGVEYRTTGGGVWTSGRDLIDFLPGPIAGNVWLHRHFAGSQAMQGAFIVCVPDGDGYYSLWGFGGFGGSGITNFGRNWMGRAGVPVAHGSLTKTGTWATYSNTAIWGGSATRSEVTGSSVSGAITGDTVGIRTNTMFNGGYAAVRVDGSAALVNRLPLVTQADVDSGAFAAQYLGWGRLDCYTSSQVGDQVIVVADGLADGVHTLEVVAQGTAPAGNSSGNKYAYISGFAGWSSSHVMGDSGVEILPIMPVSDLMTSTWSAEGFVPQIGADFRGENHGYETMESESVLLDGVDKSGMTANTWASGSLCTILRTAVVTDGTSNAFRKRLAYAAGAAQPWPLICAADITWLADVTITNVYMANKFIGIRKQGGTGVANPGFDVARVGNTIIPGYGDAPHDNTQEGRGPARTVAAYSTARGVTTYVHLPDERDVQYWGRGGAAFAQRTNTEARKLYISLTNGPNTTTVYNGQIDRSVRGWGITMRTNPALFS